jgi:hypothetical protein
VHGTWHKGKEQLTQKTPASCSQCRPWWRIWILWIVSVPCQSSGWPRMPIIYSPGPHFPHACSQSGCGNICSKSPPLTRKSP